jgi:hypothetical protein
MLDLVQTGKQHAFRIGHYWCIIENSNTADKIESVTIKNNSIIIKKDSDKNEFGKFDKWNNL